jgi:DNA-binding GntR family transcriptional regulator
MPNKTLPKPLSPIARNTMQEQVYSQIRESLSDGRFKPGQTLTIRDLAQQLGTSVMPVREALHKLTVEQVLDITANRSVRVPALSAPKFQEICEARALIEGQLAKLAAQRAGADDLDRIEEANEKFVSARNSRDPSAVLRHNREYHFAIYAAAHHPTLFNLVEPLWVRCGSSMLALFEELGEDHIKRTASKNHQTILEGIRTHSPDDAERGVIEDIRYMSERYRRHLEKVRAHGKKSAAIARSAT